MKERSKILCKDLEILLHFNFRSNRVIQLDQAGKNKEAADKVTGKLIDEFLHGHNKRQVLVTSLVAGCEPTGNQNHSFNFIKQNTA